MDLGGAKGSQGSREGVRRVHTGWEEASEGKRARGEEGKREKPEPCSSALSPSVPLLSVLPQGQLM